MADDDRGRVPFALVGVLLLVSSVAFAATVERRAPVAVDSDAGGAHQEAVAEARTALVAATERAAHAAASRPVLEPANTSVGRVLGENDTFVDALRTRVYLRARRALVNVSASRGRATATLSLPPVRNASTLREALRRVRVERRNATGFRVRIDDVTVTVRRDGRVVEREQVPLTATVRSPVFDLHARTARFADRLDTGPGDRGLGRRLQRNLLAIAWARGYAQYAGAPVANVVGTRHVELATNLGARGVQRAVFGRTDGRLDGPLGRAAAAVAGTDLVAGDAPAGRAWTALLYGPGAGGPATLPRATAAAHAADTRTVGVNLTAGRAMRDVLRGRGGPSIDDVVDDVFAAEVWLERSVACSTATSRHGERPDGWSLVRTSHSNETAVERTTPAENGTDGGHALARYAWRRTRIHTVVRTWSDGNRSRTTRTETRHVRRVRVTVVGDHAPGAVPNRTFTGPHRPGGPLGGRNYADVRERAVERLVTDRGGVGALRDRALNGSVNDTRTRLAVERPAGLRAWLYRDLAGLRDRAAAVSVRVRQGRLAATNPSARLGEALADRRSALLAAPASYGSATAAARAALRDRYLDALADRLRDRAADARAARAGLESVVPALTEGGLGSLLGPQEGAAPRTDVTAVRGVPPYLSTSAVTPAEVPALPNATRPLVTRNVNLATVPYGEVASSVAAAVLPERESSVGLHAAAATLRAANRTLRASSNATLDADRAELRARVAAVMDFVRGRVVDALAERSASISRTAAGAIVAEASSHRDTVHARALAASNGSLASAVLAAAPAAPNETAADARAMAVRLALQDAVAGARVRRSGVDDVASTVRDLARRSLATGVEAGLRRVGSAATRRLGGAVAALPAGAPLAPAPSLWVATVNAWNVTVRGRYERLSVSAVAGSPRPAPGLTYVRENRTVRLDVTGDGVAERLGRNRRVSFSASVVVPVVVPPHGSGVGDVDGVRDERSAGWPRPGPPNETRSRAERAHSVRVFAGRH